MLSSECLSLCADCSSVETAESVTSAIVAECLQCGKQFLLPETNLLAEPGASDRVVQIVPQFSAGTASRQRNIWQVLCAFVFSAFVNGGVLLLLGLLFFHVTTSRGLVLNGEFAGAAAEELSMLPVFDTGGSDSLDAMLPSVMEAAQVPRTDHGTLAVSDGLTAAGAGALSSGSGSGHGGSASGIFGGVGDAESVAYVVDASSSMAGERMRLVLQELRRSVNSLQEHQEFFVVFFNQRTYAMMWPKIEKRLVKANAVNKDRVLEWAFRVLPEHSTMPERSLRMALDLKPDIVFFLTDGDIPMGSLRTVKKYRQRKTSVHTICVGG